MTTLLSFFNYKLTFFSHTACTSYSFFLQFNFVRVAGELKMEQFNDRLIRRNKQITHLKDNNKELAQAKDCDAKEVTKLTSKVQEVQVPKVNTTNKQVKPKITIL